MSDQIIAIVKCANGNEHAGSSWITTAIFNEDTPLHVVRDWASDIRCRTGEIILSEPTEG